MLTHYKVKFLLGYIVTNLVHGCYNILSRDATRAVGVELAENGVQLLLVHEWFNIQGGDQKLCVINALISKVVHLVDDFVHFLVIDVEVRLLNRCL